MCFSIVVFKLILIFPEPLLLLEHGISMPALEMSHRTKAAGNLKQVSAGLFPSFWLVISAFTKLRHQGLCIQD